MTNRIRYRNFWIFFLAAVLTATAVSARPRMSLAPGDPAPPLQGFTYPAGKLWALDYSANELNLVNFWATWCPPCFNEMPTLQKLYDRYQDQGLGIVGVYSERVSVQKIHETISPMGIRYPLIMSGKTTDPDWGGIHSLPTTFLVDREGQILRRYVGATDEQVAGLAADIEALFAGKPLPQIVVPEEANSVAPPGTVNWKEPGPAPVPSDEISEDSADSPDSDER